MAIDRPTEEKKCVPEKAIFFCIQWFCLRMPSKNQIKFNKKGKHISHN